MVIFLAHSVLSHMQFGFMFEIRGEIIMLQDNLAQESVGVFYLNSHSICFETGQYELCSLK